MSKIIWFTIVVLMVLILSGCIDMLTKVRIDTGQKNCRNTTSNESVLTEPMIDMLCDSHCRQDLHTYQHGHTYHEWECSNADTVVCVCNR